MIFAKRSKNNTGFAKNSSFFAKEFSCPIFPQFGLTVLEIHKAFPSFRVIFMNHFKFKLIVLESHVDHF
jgi:hypothetical protein